MPLNSLLNGPGQLPKPRSFKELGHGFLEDPPLTSSWFIGHFEIDVCG